MEIKNKKVIEAGHISEVYGPVQALKNFLLKKTDKFIFIGHPFSFTNLEGTIVEEFINGEKVKIQKGHKRNKNQFWQWLNDLFFNLLFIAKQQEQVDIFIGVDNLNAMTGIIMKIFKKVDIVIYYIIDHTPRRFKNPFFNFLYELADKIACKKSDYIFAISERVKNAKLEKFKFDGRKIFTVPVGVELEKIDKFTLEEKLNSKSMIFMSYLDETKGCQLMIEAMAEIIKKESKAELLIIGTGPYENKLKEMAKMAGLEKNIKFLGAMDHNTLFKFIPHHRFGVAPYLDDKNSYTYYADPTKPKEYLACGLPVVITDVPWIAKEIGQKPMGIVCKYNKEELVNACLKLLQDDEFYKLCLKNAQEFTKDLSYDNIYNKVFNLI